MMTNSDLDSVATMHTSNANAIIQIFNEQLHNEISADAIPSEVLMSIGHGASK